MNSIRSTTGNATPGEGRWEFWIDRGGTFTDLVARSPSGEVLTHKLLSENPRQYADAAIQGIRDLMGVADGQPLPSEQIRVVKMGTTVATNALLERQGEPVLLAITRGFGDALRIGYQSRPSLFSLNIQLPEMLFSDLLEIDERVGAKGEIIKALDHEKVRAELQRTFNKGLRSIAIVLMHGYRYPEHEQRLAGMAEEIGFTQVSVSSQVSPLIKLIGRGDTTVVDAYLSPILRRYVAQVEGELTRLSTAGGLMFMQSNGGLTEAHRFQGKDAILSGPAGGVVGMVETARKAGFEKLIGFDMGGTSTDVSHYAGELERVFETEVADVRLRAPMMQIHTVAAGGGSILTFDGARMRVGPESAGANPGPASYRNGGPLTVTDCNVMLGRLHPELFPKVFGPNGDQSLGVNQVRAEFTRLAETISRESERDYAPEQVAEGYLAIAVENMANAIKRISVERGYDVSEYTLCCFGGAGGQHACQVADSLGIKQIYIHPFAGVLSAYGMGLADIREILEEGIQQPLTDALMSELEALIDTLRRKGRNQLLGISGEASIDFDVRLRLRYQGTDSTLEVHWDQVGAMREAFEGLHKQRFGFLLPETAVEVEAVQVEAIAKQKRPKQRLSQEMHRDGTPVAVYPVTMNAEQQQTPFYRREGLSPGQVIHGPAILLEQTGTILVMPGWQATSRADNDLVLQRYQALPECLAIGTQADPVMLEIFNNLFMSIAEQMGMVLENTAVSVNIKERLDFSCALFDSAGDLIANAPHIPVHLGSMSESIKTVMRERYGRMQPGDVFLLNNPYNGGTHLPDVTVVKPVFDHVGKRVIFYVAARGHHADIGGLTPGSMPPDSTTIEQEGILLDNLTLVSAGRFQEAKIREVLSSGPWPARRIDTNIADLKAQLAACEKGMQELLKMVNHFGLEVVQAYMRHVQDNAEESVRRVIDRLEDGEFQYAMDDGNQVSVKIRVDRQGRRVVIDFTGTSNQHPGNYNAPRSICRAAVMYVFRTLVNDQIPLNEGCLKPLEIITHSGSMIDPQPPAAVVAGNVETSQVIVDTLLGALQVAGASQGTMNNFTWGNAEHQYYETLCGGAGATAEQDGADAVHTHMTNSRLTDPEVLEWRFPVRLESFAIRRGSGGKGRYRGGDGVIRKLRFLEPMTANILANHRIIPPYGIEGGESGQCGRNWVEHADDRITEIGAKGQVEVAAGDLFVIETPGGGGYGKP